MTTHGIEAEVRAALAAEDADQGVDQLALAFDDMPSPVAQLADTKGVILRSRPGRPLGSKNRATLDVVKYLKATTRPSLLALKEWAALPLDEFKRLTGISDADKAFARWMQIAELVTAYEEGRPTQRVEVAGGLALPVLMFADEPVRADLVAGNPPGEGDVLNVTDFTVGQPNQGLSQRSAAEVSQSKSHDEPQPLTWQGFADDPSTD